MKKVPSLENLPVYLSEFVDFGWGLVDYFGLVVFDEFLSLQEDPPELFTANQQLGVRVQVGVRRWWTFLVVRLYLLYRLLQIRFLVQH
jgi:hypothetical protein